MASSSNSSIRGLVLLRLLAALGIVFGVMTLISGGGVVFDIGEARASAGHYVGFVVLFNFLAGFAYLLAGAGLWARRRWAAWLGAGIALATLLVFAAFGFHVLVGGAFEMRTVGAMVLRFSVWAVIALVGFRLLPKFQPDDGIHKAP